MSGFFHQAITIGKPLDEFVSGQLVNINISAASLAPLLTSADSQTQVETRTCHVPVFRLFTRGFFEFNRIDLRVGLMTGSDFM
jgi:hypothetical protein